MGVVVVPAPRFLPTMTIGPWWWRLVLLLLHVVHGSKASAAAANKPFNNILLLLTDDQDVLLGSFDTHMPSVRHRLREFGVTFRDGALVHVPICCPSRSSLLTGKYLHHGRGLATNNSVSGNCYSGDWIQHEEDVNTFAVHLQSAGYTTLYAGKYLNQYHAKDDYDDDIRNNHCHIPRGWDHWYGLEGNSRYYNYSVVEKSGEGTCRVHHHKDAYPGDYLPLVLQNYTLETLPRLPEPWLAVVAWPTPHGPFTPEPKYARDFATAQAPRDVSFNASKASQDRKHWLVRQLHQLSNATARTIDAVYRDRLRALETVDDHVGKLLDWLEEKDEEDKDQTTNQEEDEDEINEQGIHQLENKPRDDDAFPEAAVSAIASARHRRRLEEPTRQKKSPPLPSESSHTSPSSSRIIDRTVVVYTSDNGFQLGQHRLAVDKRHLYEHDIRVPLVVRGPGIPPNRTLPREVIASLVDLAPTVLAIAQEGWRLAAAKDGPSNNKNNKTQHQRHEKAIIRRLERATAQMDGLSFWKYLRNLNDSATETIDDPFGLRTDVLISYHGEGTRKCNLTECPPPWDGLWWMPDAYNNTYHCLRTLRGRAANDSRPPEDSIYCVFGDDEGFREYYDLRQNPHQLGNDYDTLTRSQKEAYERRLAELLS